MKDYEDVCDQITLTLDDDSELLCDVIKTFSATVNDKEQMYIALIPTDNPESDIFLYRFFEDGEEIDLQNIEDDDEFDIVCDTFDELLDKEEFDNLVGDDEEE